MNMLAGRGGHAVWRKTLFQDLRTRMIAAVEAQVVLTLIELSEVLQPRSCPARPAATHIPQTHAEGVV